MKVHVNNSAMFHVHKYTNEEAQYEFVMTSKSWLALTGDIKKIIERIDQWPLDDVKLQFESRKEKREYVNDLDEEIACLTETMELLKHVRDTITHSRKNTVQLKDWLVL